MKWRLARYGGTLILVVALAVAGCAGSPPADVKPAGPARAVAITREPSGRILMENDTIKLMIDPTQGGSVVSFVHKPLGKDVVPPNRGGDRMGLFLDHYWEDGWPWPGEMMPAKYEVVEIRSEPAQASVRMRYTLKGSYAGKSDPKVQGLVFEKTLSLHADQDAVFCRVLFRNPTDETRMVAYWLQNYYHVGGDYDAGKDVSARPTTAGIFRAGRIVGKDFIRDVTRGWSAATDTEKRHGMVWLMGYDYLNSLYNYNSNVTQEWVYDRVLIPAGKVWETDVVLLPFSNVRNISSASQNLIAGLRIARKDGKILLTHSLRQGTRPAGDVQLGVEVMSGATDRRAQFSLKVGAISDGVMVVTQEIAEDIPDPLIVKVTATGESGGGPFEEKYWDFYVGTYGYGANVQVDMVTPVYQQKRPEKKPVLLKPDVIRRIREKRLYYAMMGLFSGCYRLDEAFRLAGQERAPEGMPTVGEYTLNTYGMGPQISAFPFDYDILMRYDAVVVANVNLDCLGPIGKEMLHDYVTHGGGLLVLGGKAAYGAGGWRGSRIEELLPVELNPSGFDLEKIENSTLRPGEPHWITKDIDLSSGPRVEFVHRVAAVKQGAKVLLYAGKKPFLATWETDDGRAACILGTPYGPEAGQYFRWEHWPALMKNILQWLGGRGG